MTDYSLYADLLTRLQAATSEQEKDWMVTEFGLNQLPPPVRDAVWAAAIPHQFDRGFLGFLLIPLKRNRWKDFFYSYIAKFLGKSFREQAQRYFHGLTEEEFKTLLSQSYIEHLWDGGYAVHESTRKLLLAKLYQDEPQRYRKLNRRAAIYCQYQNQQELRWRVATLYHQVLADLDRIEVDFYNQARDWWSIGSQLDKIEALIRPMLEEVHAHRVNEKIAARTFLWQGVLDDFYGRPFKAKEYLTQAIQLFQQLQDELNAAESIFRLGNVHLKLSDYEAARTQYQQALPLFQQMDNKLGEANYIQSLGDVHLRLSDYEAALTQYQQALPFFQQMGDKLGEANCIARLGDVHLRLSDYEAALTQYQQALPFFQQMGDKLGEANCIARLGDVHLRLSDYEAARTQYQQALPFFQQMGDKLGEANCIARLGDVHLRLSDYEAARTQYQQALPLFQQMGDKLGEANCMRSLGQVIAQQGQINDAVATLKHAAKLYHTIGLIVDKASCFDRIANIYRDQKRYEDVLAAYRHALDIAPEGEEVYRYHNRARTYITLELLDEIKAIYGERAEFEQMRTLITDDLAQRFPEK